ncbi:hypothetical protein [Kitasatospora sp. MAA4]|uniref:hypothetical protein n=1 Tax=Kitasatospora sp. MAA4 TaxID=3035093 RepID=UPI0024739E08|nr:hypothetical protein [Kitasatospora sp. MAA4]
MITASPEGPFRSPDPLDQQREWIDAALATPEVNLPRGALENIAPFLVDSAETLSGPDGNNVRRLRRDILRRISTDAGEMVVAVVRMHGVGGIVWEHNERISSSWHSAADPSALRMEQRSLARIRPYSRIGKAGQEKDFAALESSVESREWLVANTVKAAEELSTRDGMRPYDLREDLVLNGQQEPGLYLAQHILLDDAPLEDAQGRPLHPAEHWAWMAVRGNNRTKQRQEIYGVTSAQVLTGMPVAKLGGDGEEVVFDPNNWLPRLSGLLNKQYEEHVSQPDPWDSRLTTPGFRAAKVAVVEAHLVVGSPTPRRLYRIAQMSNRRDHVHPPLEFTPNDRGRALGRSVLGTYAAESALNERVAEVLSGAAPITELPGVPEDASVSELRDLRSMLLLGEFFPTDPRKRHLIRRSLSESPPSQLSAPEVNRRARAWSALTSESYPHPWNPRIAEVFQLSEIRDGITLSRRRLPDLLAAADIDGEAFEELIAYRAAHWLAAFDIIDADRGSLTGQKTDDDGTRADRVRRTVKNNLNAMRNNRRMAVGVMRELAAAMDEGDRRPRKVSPAGVPLLEPMNRAWFNREFPKESGTRPRKPPAPATRATSADSPGPAETHPTLWTPADRAPVPTEAAREAPATGESEPPLSAARRPTAERPVAERWADALQDHITRLAAETAAIRALLTQVGERAHQQSVRFALSRHQTDEAAYGMLGSEVELRKLRVLMEGMTEPA